MTLGGVCMKVTEEGREVLVYHFASIAEAAKTFDFISEFFPQAQFVIEPIRH